MPPLVKQLWAGEIPLGQAFWRYAVVVGLLVNLVTSALLLALLAHDASLAWVALSFVLPIPYNVFAVVAVWRSAARYQGPETRAELARIVSVVWMILLTAA